MMNFDPAQITQMLSNIQFPLGKSQVVQMARERGLNAQVADMLEQMLPDKQFSSQQDLQNTLTDLAGKMGNMGNLGGMFGGLKF